MPASRRLRAALFVVIVGLVVAGTLVGPYLAMVGGSPPMSATYGEYNASKLVPTRADASGSVAVDKHAESGTVLIDETHLNRFSRAEIQPLVSAITAAGYQVDYVTGAESIEDALPRGDALVVIDPGFRYDSDEAARIERFVDAGGRLLLLAEPTTLQLVQGGLGGATFQETTNELTSVSSRFGIEVEPNYLFNMEENDGNFRNVFADATGGDGLLSGVDRATFPVAAPLATGGATTLLAAADGTRSSRTDSAGTYPIAARRGNVVAIGDASFLKRVNYQVTDNEALVANLASFLVAGTPERTLRDYPYLLSANVTVQYTSSALLDAAQALGTDLADADFDPELVQDGSGVGDADVLVTTFEELDGMDTTGTGIDVGDETVAVGSYESGSRGIIVVHAPEEAAVDLVIAADTADRVLEGAELVAFGGIEEYLVSDRTAVRRTFAARTPTATPTETAFPGGNESS